MTRPEDDKVNLVAELREHVGWNAYFDFQARGHVDAGGGGKIALKCGDELPLSECLAIGHDLFRSQSAGHPVIDRATHLERRTGSRRDGGSKVKGHSRLGGVIKADADPSESVLGVLLEAARCDRKRTLEVPQQLGRGSAEPDTSGMSLSG